MVKRYFTTVLMLVLLLVFSVQAIAIDDMGKVEQIQTKLPEIKVWFYAQESTDSANLHFDGTILNSDYVRKPTEEDIIHHYFLVDTSTSTSTAQMQAVKASITEFADKMTVSDRVTLISFGVEVKTLLNSETDIQTIKDSVSTLTANEDMTLFFDAIATVSELAKEEEIATERKLLYVFSDSVDYNLGGYTVGETEALLKNANLPLYALGFDNGTKENLDNFGALARASGGDIRIVSAFDTQSIFAELSQSLKDDVMLAGFSSKTNIIPSGDLGLTFEVADESFEFQPTINFSTPDEIVPTISEVVQISPDSIEITFSEAVTGANVRDNYIISREDDTLIGITAATFDESNNTALLTLNEGTVGGEFMISTTGIADISTQKNAVTSKVPLTFVFEEVVEEEPISSVAIIAATLAVIALIVSIIAVTNAKKKKARLNAENVDITEELGSIGDTGRAHFIQKTNKQIKLEVTNTMGDSKSVTLPINKTLFVGRSDICDVFFDDARMSRQHFVIEETEHGFTVTNLSETVGTALNGVPINETRKLNHGDCIEAGSQRIIFKTIT